MVIVTRQALEPASVGYEKTWLFHVNHRGKSLDLTDGTGGPFTITAVAATEAGTKDISVTVANYTQAGDDVGLFKGTIASTELTAARAGEWYVDVFITASGGNAQPLEYFAFTLYASETEA